MRPRPPARKRIRPPNYTPGFIQAVFPNTDRSSNLIDGTCDDSFPPNRRALGQPQKQSREPSRYQVTVDVLPDDVLLEIFGIYITEARWEQAWKVFVHVCQRWRRLVFAKPRGLNLRLICTPRTAARATLAVWPALPIVIIGLVDQPATFAFKSQAEVVDNFTAALEHKNRVCHIDLQSIPNSILGSIAAAMEEPFPALTDLALASNRQTPPVLPDMFLGGSAPHLRSLRLTGIPFPALGKLLLSASHLVQLSIWDVPHSGYISPEAMAMALAALANLGEFCLGFRSPQSRPGRANRRLPSVTPVTIPILSTLEFKGVSEYFEDLVSRIDAPLLNKVVTTFFNQLMFDTPQLTQFFRRTNELKAPYRADVFFHDNFVGVRLYSQRRAADRGVLGVTVNCEVFDWQLSSVAQVCSSSLRHISTLEFLFIHNYRSRAEGQEDIDNAQWLELLEPFTSVKEMYLSKELALRCVDVLQEVGGVGVTDVLPELQHLYIEGLRWEPHQYAIWQFVYARQLSGRPVSVQRGGNEIGM